MVFFEPELRPGLRLSEKSERAGEAGAEDSTEAEGERAGEDALEEERLRSTGWDWGWLLHRARMA